MLTLHEGKSQLLIQSPAVIYLTSLAPGSHRTIRQSLNMIASMIMEGSDMITFPWQDLRYQHTQAVRSLLAQKYAPATANKMLSALKKVLIECKRLGLMSVDDCDRATDLKQIKGESPQKGRALSEDEIKKLFSICINDTSNAGLRDGALLTMLRVGLRRSEVVALDTSDLDIQARSVVVRKGKGSKARIVFIPKFCVPMMQAWLDILPTPSPLFMAISRADNIIWSQRLSNQAIPIIARKRAEQAGIAQDFTAHDFRRTFIGDLFDAGADISSIQKLAGHSSPQTSASYDRRGDYAKIKAVDLLEY